MCGYPNQQGYVETRTANLQDEIKIIVQGDQYKITDSENRQSIHFQPVEEKTESRRQKYTR